MLLLVPSLQLFSKWQSKYNTTSYLSDIQPLTTVHFYRHVPSTYKPPHRNRLGGDLLKLNAENTLATLQRKLMIKANIYGLAIYSDGATVKKMPLINILVSGVEEQCACLEIVDATDHLIDGGTKDARFIAEKLLTHMNTLDKHQELFDAAYFDGASNVQKAGRVLAVHYPRLSVFHGAEHVVNLFFSDISQIPIIHALIVAYRQIQSLMGGSHHAPHALVGNQSKAFNNGRKLGLIQAAGNRYVYMCSTVIDDFCGSNRRLTHRLITAAWQATSLPFTECSVCVISSRPL
jgi:hypothetical protein